MSADHSDKSAIEKRMMSAAKKLHELAPEVGMAKTVIEYDSDRRKNLLAKYVAKHKGEDSHSAAEAAARSDPEYDKEFQQLFSQMQMAQTTIKTWDAEYASWDTGRSLLAMQRQMLHSMPEQSA